MSGNWRQMRHGDIAHVSRIATTAHPDFPEDDVVFSERLQFAPEGCFIFELDGDICGYLLSHPWLAGDIPPLNTLLKKLPERPQTWYLHDIALMPQVRSRGATAPGIGRLLSVARDAGMPSVSLVAVNGSQPFWERFGFSDARSDGLKEKLLSYDEAARYMVRML